MAERDEKAFIRSKPPPANDEASAEICFRAFRVALESRLQKWRKRKELG
jgi:hypothetical protein